ncbi:hypothetical protein DFP72DRAFT_862311 [Ephemerocybe angulata]|uniref:Uncharacterized protein n=1 Tax=Ephemerocybe angulata TaxID=980116 RepID=A0A8H6H6L2_9AGAR|nr:hypothetical protein DFP72DRAFT_862311 [Tulosesus angulatus]
MAPSEENDIESLLKVHITPLYPKPTPKQKRRPQEDNSIEEGEGAEKAGIGVASGNLTPIMLKIPLLELKQRKHTHEPEKREKPVSNLQWLMENFVGNFEKILARATELNRFSMLSRNTKISQPEITLVPYPMIIWLPFTSPLRPLALPPISPTNRPSRNGANVFSTQLCLLLALLYGQARKLQSKHFDFDQPAKQCLNGHSYDYIVVNLKLQKNWQRKLDSEELGFDGKHNSIFSQWACPVLLLLCVSLPLITVLASVIGHVYNVYQQPSKPAIDFFHHIKDWKEFYKMHLLCQPLEDKDYIFPTINFQNLTVNPVTPITGQAVDKTIKKWHLQQGYQSLTHTRPIVIVVVGDTLIQYLLDELHTYKEDYSDVLCPIDETANRVHIGEDRLLWPFTSADRQAHTEKCSQHISQQFTMLQESLSECMVKYLKLASRLVAQCIALVTVHIVIILFLPIPLFTLRQLRSYFRLIACSHSAPPTPSHRPKRSKCITNPTGSQVLCAQDCSASARAIKIILKGWEESQPSRCPIPMWNWNKAWDEENKQASAYHVIATEYIDRFKQDEAKFTKAYPAHQCMMPLFKAIVEAQQSRNEAKAADSSQRLVKNSSLITYYPSLMHDACARPNLCTIPGLVSEPGWVQHSVEHGTVAKLLPPRREQRSCSKAMHWDLWVRSLSAFAQKNFELLPPDALRKSCNRRRLLANPDLHHGGVYREGSSGQAGGIEKWWTKPPMYYISIASSMATAYSSRPLCTLSNLLSTCMSDMSPVLQAAAPKLASADHPSTHHNSASAYTRQLYAGF